MVVRRGLAADVPPGALETAVARRLVWLSIPAATRAQTNPHATDRDAWKDGADHFAEHCAVCHGSTGRGASGFAAHMYPPVPNLASDDVQRLSDGALFAIIDNGVRWTGMPAFRGDHSADEIWKLVAFVRHVPQAADDPQQAHDDHHERTSHDDHEHSPSPDDHRPGRSAAGTISMDGTGFTPRELTVHAGDTVRWVNKDPFPHNVASGAGGFKSGDLDPDAQWQFTPTRAGRFPYVCTLHPGMSGTLIVEP
jgi:plastocyanin